MDEIAGVDFCLALFCLEFTSINWQAAELHFHCMSLKCEHCWVRGSNHGKLGVFAYWGTGVSDLIGS